MGFPCMSGVHLNIQTFDLHSRLTQKVVKHELSLYPWIPTHAVAGFGEGIASSACFVVLELSLFYMFPVQILHETE